VLLGDVDTGEGAGQLRYPTWVGRFSAALNGADVALRYTGCRRKFLLADSHCAPEHAQLGAGAEGSLQTAFLSLGVGCDHWPLLATSKYSLGGLRQCWREAKVYRTDDRAFWA
jgi:hypothetical protein